jgi:metallo-beta-lactamase family protein
VQIDLDGQMYDIRAKVMTLSGYSGHADQAGLVRFALGGGEPAGRVVLVHGEQGAKMALRQALEARSKGLGIEQDCLIAD